MNDRQNIVIVLLLVTAALLSMMLIFTSSEAVAGNTAARYQDYIMCPGERSTSSDNIYVIDVQEKKLITYWVEPGTDSFEPTDIVDLEKVFKKR